jgi:hypothetical protein
MVSAPASSAQVKTGARFKDNKALSQKENFKTAPPPENHVNGDCCFLFWQSIFFSYQVV